MVDTILSSIISDLEQVPNSQPLSLTAIENLQSLLDTDESDLLHQFFSVVPSSLLLPPLTSAMDSSTHNHTHLSLLSSLTYLSLLLSPHSPTLSLFSPLPFLSLLHSLRSSLKKHDHNHLHPSSSSRGPHAKNNKARKKRNARNSDDENENDIFGGGSGGGREVFDLRLFLDVVEKLGLVLDLVHLNRFPDCLKSLISTTVEIPVIASEKCANSAGSFNKLADLCIKVLYQVLKSEHGEEGETAVEVFKALTPLILGGKSQGRNFALGFVKGLVAGVVGRSDGVKKSVANLPRYLVHKAPEKAEPRGWAVEAVMEIVKAMEPADQIAFAGYVVKMTQGKPNLRLLGVDLILNLMMMLKDPFGLDLVSETKDSWGFSCLRGLIQRCSDSNAGIRSRALSNLAHLVGFLSNDGRNCVVLKEVMGLGEGEKEGAEVGLNDVLRKRCMDEKANVRRAALVLTTRLTALLGGNFDEVVLKTMGMACSDPLVSIRKAAISALSEAFRTFSDDSVTVEWLHSVPHLISDNESSIQEECENLFEELVLNSISRVAHASTTRNTSTHSHSNSKGKSMEMETDLIFPEGILILLKEMCNGEVAPWVRKICTSLGKKNRLKPVIASALQNIISMSESHWLGNSMPIEKWSAPAGAWFLLSEVSLYLSRAIEWKFLHHHWKLLDKYRAAGECRSPPEEEIMHEDDTGMESNSITRAGDRVFLLQTISNVAVELPPERAAELAHNFLKRIEEFNMHSTEVNAHVKALRTLCKRKALSTEEANTLVMKVVQQVLSKACRILEKYISGDSKAEKENTFLTPPSRKGKKAATVSKLLAEAVTAVYTVGSLVIVCPSADMGAIIPLLHTIITSGNSYPNLSKLPGSTVSLKHTAPSLYFQAWLAMGKICLADGKLAKSYIPLFVQELEKSDCAALRNNIVVMMADFCVRYTALIDCYITKITRCLRDPCELVRRQTFILLSRLLQRDYVKWRGVLFLRFLLPLVDESEKIRQLADFLIGNILKVKAPLLAYNSFVEAIFVLNDCRTQNGSKNSQTENRLFSIRGNVETSRSKRMHIYVSLLRQMAPEHLLATFAKLCAEILAAASDGMLNIDDVRGQSVLQDAFQILSCKEIRIPTGQGSQTDADMEEEGEDGVSAAAAKGRAITQALRKSLIQNTIPIFIELKRLLESKNSPLIGSLMECLRILLKDNKNEIDDILIADKQLQKELIYDIQKYESNKAKSTAAEAVATMQQNAATSAAFLSPGAPKFTEKLHGDSRVASAMADAAAAATALSVLREMNRGTMTPSLSSINVPKLKSTQGGNGGRHDRPLEVLESLRRRQSFNSDDEN